VKLHEQLVTLLVRKALVVVLKILRSAHVSPLVERRSAVVALDDGVFDVLCHVGGID
jgi:hypothetical protein